ncbi:MAG: tRNA lysidine(34) synthetase TilS [Nitrospira sp. SCN 59-13]|nr:MAG: tRNA lysidine(34) synthetase TilS [Nitrospira sp. SCN 59-13]
MAGSSTAPHPLHNKVARALRTRALLQPGQSVLVAVSGGPDSVALLSLLHELTPAWNFSLTVVHCNYGLRGAESDGDASFVVELCRRLKLPCLVRALHIPVREPGHSSSLQARARELRYRLFRDLVTERGSDRVALGHTADDQAETVLLRMLRGTGLRGLGGMPHSRGNLFVRPLLTVTRREILSYLEMKRLSFRADSSNATSVYLRNRVRHELLPVMQSLAPATVRLLARQADIVREDDQLLERLAARRLVRAILSRDSQTLILHRGVLLEQHAALQRRMLRQAMQTLSSSAVGARGEVVLSLLASLSTRRSGGSWTVGSLVVTAEQGQVRITVGTPAALRIKPSPQPATNMTPESVTQFTLPCNVTWPLTGALIHISLVTGERGIALLKDPSATIAIFDAERLSLPLAVRSWRPGDYFFPAGMAGRRKKLQDYFTDAKLGRSMREHIPLLLSREHIAWIVGHRIDARFAATASTTRFIVARVTHSVRRKGVL